MLDRSHFTLEQSDEPNIFLDNVVSVCPPSFHEGLVGAVFEDQEVFVTTPNQYSIFSPLRNSRSIRLRHEPHFGEEDPLYFPQPFSSTLAHLALIPLPSTNEDNPYFIAWYRPTPTDFLPVNPEDKSGASCGLGMLSSDIRSRLRVAIDDIVSTPSDGLLTRVIRDGSTHPKVATDTYVSNYTNSLKWMMAQLNCASTFSCSTMMFALAQRVYLELVARVDWLKNYQPHYQSATTDRSNTVASVVGALVDNMEAAHSLWRLGIPLWLVRDVKLKDPNLRVDKWIESPQPTENLAARSEGFRLSLEDSEPPNVVIWTGVLVTTKFDRYAAMARTLRSFATAHLYEEEPHPTPTSQTIPVASTSCQKDTKPPRKRQRTAGPTRPPAHVRNKFDEVASDIMPLSVKPWLDAAHDVGQIFNPNSHSRPLGYFLLDAQMIAGLGSKTGDLTTRIAYLEVWLKLRHVLLHRLKTPSIKPLSPSRWRTLLGIQRLQFRDAKSLQQKAEVEEMLTEARAVAGMQAIDITRLDTTAASWQKASIEVAKAPPKILQEVLWELLEVAFRYEFLIMDRRFYRGHLSKDEREPEVLSSLIRHFEGTLIPPDLTSATAGFASTSLFDRRMALWGILLTMDDWRGAGTLPAILHKDSALRKRFDMNQDIDLHVREVDEIEYSVARHYISTFATTFGRAPTLPHRLS